MAVPSGNPLTGIKAATTILGSARSKGPLKAPSPRRFFAGGMPAAFHAALKRATCGHCDNQICGRGKRQSNNKS